MVNLVTYIQNQAFLAYEWADEVGETIQEEISNHIEGSKESFADAYEAITQSCRQKRRHFNQNCQATVDKVKLFIYKNKEALFFIGCSAATAYFAPFLFFPVAIATTVLRIEFSHHLKNLADEYLKEDKNPYKLNRYLYYENCVSSLDLIMGTIGAADAIALGTIFMTNSWTIFLLPAIVGVAAGNCAAKLGMNISHFLAYSSSGGE